MINLRSRKHFVRKKHTLIPSDISTLLTAFAALVGSCNEQAFSGSSLLRYTCDSKQSQPSTRKGNSHSNRPNLHYNTTIMLQTYRPYMNQKYIFTSFCPVPVLIKSLKFSWADPF